MALCAGGDSSSEESELEHGGKRQHHSHHANNEREVEIKVNREVFETYLRGRTFYNWQDFVDAAAQARGSVSTAPSAAADFGSVVKLDPMQVFAWVATLMMEIAIWGIVAWSAMNNYWVGAVASGIYGAGLYYAASQQFSQGLATMIWPNVPCAVAAAGALMGLAATAGSGLDNRTLTGVMLGFSIMPQTLAAGLWMAAVPQDSTRASMVTNLLLGVWATVQAGWVMATVDEEAIFGYPFGSSNFYFMWGTLVAIGVLAAGVACFLFAVPTRHSNDHLISWTLNVGSLFMFVGTCLLAGVPFTSPGDWIWYLLVCAALAFFAHYLGRSFPWILCALGFTILAARVCGMVAEWTRNGLIGLLAFGAFGVGIAITAQVFCGARASSERHPVRA